MAIEIATVGDNCIDRFLPPIGLSLVGGNAVNVAVQLSRLGHKVRYFGAVGNDDHGRRMLSCFADNGLLLDRLQIVDGATAYTDLEVDMTTGDRKILFEEFGVCRGYRPSAEDMQHLLRMRHVHIGWLDDGGALRRTLQSAGVCVSQDVSVNADPENLGAQGLDIAFASAGADRVRAEHLLNSLLAGGAKLAVVTRGLLGSIASDGITRVETGIRPVAVVDTTGAGDSFIAGFVSGLLHGADLQTSLHIGRDTAAETCRHIGGFPQPALSFQQERLA